jgi:aspergillopepsin I
LGLAFSSINTVQPTKQKTFFDTVKSSLAQPLFAADLKPGQTGYYDFGYIESSAYTGSITYTSVDSSQGFWGFTAGAYSTGSSASPGTVGASIMDTGTTLLYIPAAAVRDYYAQVPGGKYDSNQGGYVGSCSGTWPAWNVKIGGTTFAVSGSIIRFQPLGDGSNNCFGGIQSSASVG